MTQLTAKVHNSHRVPIQNIEVKGRCQKQIIIHPYKKVTAIAMQYANMEH